MKLNFFIFSFLLFFIVGTLAPLVLAEEAPQYNFGSMQAGKSFSVQPGQEITTKLYFYNIYGNRPTHINLTIVEKPQNWQVLISPDVHRAEYEVSGQKVSVDENLVVYPSNASQTTGQNTETIEYIQSSVGYIASNFVTIKIKVPENEKTGKSFNVKINGVASWLGQGGNIALNQERDFEYTVTTTTSYYEKPLGEETETGNKTSTILSIFSNQQIKPVYLLMTGITFILAIIFIILVILVRKKKKKKRR